MYKFVSELDFCCFSSFALLPYDHSKETMRSRGRLAGSGSIMSIGCNLPNLILLLLVRLRVHSIFNSLILF